MNALGFHISFYLLCAILIWMALRGMLHGGRALAFPTIAALLGLAWVVPQGIELENRPYNIYESGGFWLYVAACFGLLSLGFNLGKRAQVRRIRLTPRSTLPVFNTQRLLGAAAGLTMLGIVAVLLMREVDTSKMGSQWTGVITMYALMSKASGLGLCLSVLVYVRTKSRVALLIAAVAAGPIVASAIYGVRREQIFDLFVLTFGAWYMTKGRSPSPVVMISALFFGTFVLNSATNLRTYVESERSTIISALLTPDTYAKFDFGNLGQGNASEVGLSQYDYWYMNRNSEWELGSEYWNSLIHQYVPAFLFGRQFKDNLQVETLSDRLESEEVKGRFSVGSTRTGFSDTYRSFGVFGAIVFGIIGSIFGYLFAKAIYGSLSSQYLYLVLLAEGLKSITHSTSEFFASLPFVLLISWTALRFSRSGAGQRRETPALASVRLKETF